MNEAGLVLGALAIAATVYGIFCLGRLDGADDLEKAKRDLVTANSVKHNLNCLVCDLRHECKELRPDALAYRTSIGLWCTDQPELIRHHAKKERFFRLGYPEHHL